jgi:D-serine deaminase-like pyridoxal phosphate-dependent protein
MRPRGSIVGWIEMAPPEKSTTTETENPVAEPITNGHPPVDEETRPISAIDTPTPLPLPTPLEAYERFEAIFDGLQAPFAFLDLDAVWANAADMLRRSRGKPIRIASKSIRSRPVLERLLNLDPGFQGALTYTLAETIWLWERGLRDLVVAYPTTDRACLTRLARITSEDPDQAPVAMVDCPEHLDLIEEAASSFVAPIRVAIDIDLSWWPLGGLVKIGPRRSPIRTAEAAVSLAQEIDRRERTRLVGVMAYEGQIAGIGDNVPRKAITNLVVRAMQSASAKDVAERRAEIVTALSEVCQLEFVNGGGTGSIESTASEWAVTEVAAGSGFHAPVLFDHYRAFRPRPAAMFALPVIRPSGIKAIEVVGARRALPGPGSDRPRIGDRIYFRDLAAGELCEHFDRLFLVTGTTIRNEVPTYRGEGKSFL